MIAPAYCEDPSELFDSTAIEDPYPLYARLRRDRPISRIANTGVHLVATWDLIAEALERESDFSANLTGVLIRGSEGQPTLFELPDNPASRVIATADEPAHTVHRGIVQPRLTPSRVARLEDSIRDWARDAIAAWLANGAGDFVPTAEAIPARAVAALLGLPQSDVAMHRRWSMMGGDILAGDVDTLRMIVLAEETQKMLEYLGQHFASALERTEDHMELDQDAPLLDALARGVHDGSIDTDDAVGIASVMFGAGGESTAALIGSVARYLATDNALASRMRDEPGSIVQFVEEVARLEPPFKFHYRVVRRDCRLGDIELAAGNRLMLLWASANRDARHIKDPDAFQLDRPHAKNHLSFGRGPHFCVGAGLARLEARIVCEELLSAAEDLRLVASQPPAHVPSIFVRRLERLPLSAVPKR